MTEMERGKLVQHMELPKLGNGDDSGVEEAEVAYCESAGFTSTCLGDGSAGSRYGYQFFVAMDSTTRVNK